MSAPLEAKRLTVKVGSALLVDANGEIRTSWLDSLAADLLARRRRGQEVIVVTSGAIALGRCLLRLPRRPEEKKAAAGQLIPPQAVSGIARPEVAKRESIARLDQRHALDAGHVKGLPTALECAAGRFTCVISGVARAVIERTQREAAAGAFTA